jgi:hypothetical protein
MESPCSESDLLLAVVARRMPAPCRYAFGSPPAPDDPVVFLGPVTRRGMSKRTPHPRVFRPPRRDPWSQAGS